ncbi:MAG: flagellar protein FliS [Candidatus Zixiibacteriota bacterium]|nr:MAG: flagellar protein FliS [candidate division Zixibacteria bacterium]
MKEGLAAYQETDMLGKSQLDLVIKVYDGAIEAYRAARKAYEEEDNDSGYEQLQRAKRFITHLYTTLNMEEGGAIAEQLGRIYAFVINQTSVIEATKDLKQIDDNVNILNNLRLGWVGLKEQAQNNQDSQRSEADEVKEPLATTG